MRSNTLNGGDGAASSAAVVVTGSSGGGLEALLQTNDIDGGSSPADCTGVQLTNVAFALLRNANVIYGTRGLSDAARGLVFDAVSDATVRDGNEIIGGAVSISAIVHPRAVWGRPHPKDERG